MTPYKLPWNEKKRKITKYNLTNRQLKQCDPGIKR